MDKLRNLRIIARLKTLLHSDASAMSMSTHLIWMLVLGVAFTAAVALCLFAWLSYTWATTEGDIVFSRTSHEAFSIEELRGVINAYQKKESDYAALHHARPEAPNLGAESGVSGGN